MLEKRYERKFYIRPNDLQMTYFLLRQTCRDDHEYPENQINTLYFDTDNLDEFMQSQEGNRRREKIRIRWYDDPFGGNEVVSVYFELKTKDGFVSSKQRRKITVPSNRLSVSRISEGIISNTALTRILSEYGYIPKMPYKPVILVSYRRRRLTEIMTGFRISFDYGINSIIVAPGISRGEGKLHFGGGVVEIKSKHWGFPPTFCRFKMIDMSWSRFSKYSYCLESHLQTPGSISGLWPSGVFYEKGCAEERIG
jgi:hypothetical protein